MALNYLVTIRNDMTTTGNKTISLASNFDPKAVIVIAGKVVTVGTAVVNYNQCIGFGTYRGSAVQQNYATMRGLNAATIADLSRAKAPARSSNCSRTQQAPLRLDLR